MFKELKLIRLQNELTQQEMADRLGITLNYYNKLERSKREPSFKLIRRICHEFDLPLFGDDITARLTDTTKETVEDNEIKDAKLKSIKIFK